MTRADPSWREDQASSESLASSGAQAKSEVQTSSEAPSKLEAQSKSEAQTNSEALVDPSGGAAELALAGSEEREVSEKSTSAPPLLAPATPPSTQTSPFLTPLVLLGRLTLSVFDDLGGSLLLGARVFRQLFRREMDWRESLRKISVFGLGSLWVLSVTSIMVGGILTVQASLIVLRFGIHELLGWIVGFGVFRELGPLVTGMLFSGQVGSRNAAELASMSTRDQLEGLRASGIDAIPVVIAPRVLAIVVSLVCLYLLGSVLSILSAAASSWLMLGVDGWQFFRPFWARIEVLDVFVGLIKSVVFALSIGLISSREGVRARGGAFAVGNAAKSAVVKSAIAIVIFDLLVLYLF